MDAVERLVTEYRSAVLGADGEASGKIEALKSLEEFLPNLGVLDFFLGIIADRDEYDMARVYLLKLLKVDPPPERRERIAHCIAAVLPDEEDWIVRCWLGRTLSAYTDIRAARVVAIERVLDTSEDEDVRHNCLSGLHGSDPDVVPVLEQLAGEDSSLGRAARRSLKRPRER